MAEASGEHRCQWAGHNEHADADAKRHAAPREQPHSSRPEQREQQVELALDRHGPHGHVQAAIGEPRVVMDEQGVRGELLERLDDRVPLEDRPDEQKRHVVRREDSQQPAFGRTAACWVCCPRRAGAGRTAGTAGTRSARRTDAHLCRPGCTGARSPTRSGCTTSSYWKAFRHWDGRVDQENQQHRDAAQTVECGEVVFVGADRANLRGRLVDPHPFPRTHQRTLTPSSPRAVLDRWSARHRRTHVRPARRWPQVVERGQISSRH